MDCARWTQLSGRVGPLPGGHDSALPGTMLPPYKVVLRQQLP